MKNDTQPAAPSTHTFKTIKEVEAHAKGRMEKAITGLQHEMASIRTGRASISFKPNHRSLSRKPIRTGGSNATTSPRNVPILVASK